MSEFAELSLLPEGLHDVLPGDAEHEAEVIEALLERFGGQGYERVKPPLIEFEESLLTGPGGRVGRHMFRLMDPISQRMMGLRADMTTQVARIAVTRLGHVARPLRLCYSGQVLRVRGDQLRPERQFAQAGVELIGAEEVGADAEVVLLAREALAAAGVAGVSVDLTTPALPHLVCESLDLDPETAEAARVALDKRDGAALSALPAAAAAVLQPLSDAAGSAASALAALDRLELPAAAASLRDRLAALVALLERRAPDLTLTIDPGESHGFEYQTGVSFALFARGVRGELGRGGRYQLASGEAATGFTLYLDTLMRALGPAAPTRRLYLPLDQVEEGPAWRAQGWRTVQGLAPLKGDAAAEARRLRCSHVLIDGEALEI